MQDHINLYTLQLLALHILLDLYFQGLFRGAKCGVAAGVFLSEQIAFRKRLTKVFP